MYMSTYSVSLNFLGCNHLVEDKRADCFTLNVFLLLLGFMHLFLGVPWVSLILSHSRSKSHVLLNKRVLNKWANVPLDRSPELIALETLLLSTMESFEQLWERAI